MRMQVVRVSRSPQWPLWAVLIVLLWMALGAATVLLSSYSGKYVELCLFKRLTGFPCPTCGLTRGVICALHGHIIQAWLYNPLLFSVLTILFVVYAARLILARTLKIHLTRSERIIAWILAVVLLLANWAYVIFYIG